MGKPLAEYTAADWWRLRPLTQRLKERRYRAINARHMRQPARGGDLSALIRLIRGRNVLVAVAFNDAEVIDWQARLVRRFVPNAVYVVVDNSTDEAAAEAIAAAAQRHGTPYLRLPSITWSRALTSRSHGLALNWTWNNLLKPAAPRAFGLIDDDLFPLAPTDPFAPLASQPFYGLVRTAGPRWFLWAGFSMFRFDAVAAKPLNFAQDWFIGLDTGGGNWELLYRHADLGRLAQATVSLFPYKDGVSVDDGPMQWCDGWLHEIGSTGRPELMRDKRPITARMLAPYLDAASAMPAEATSRT